MMNESSSGALGIPELRSPVAMDFQSKCFYGLRTLQTVVCFCIFSYTKYSIDILDRAMGIHQAANY